MDTGQGTGSTSHGSNGKLRQREPGGAEARAKSSRAAKPGKQPKAAASLTAEVVARGRQRTQAYGEAGLWRGVAGPPPEEAPVRMVLPPPKPRAAARDAREPAAEAAAAEPRQEALRLPERPDAPEAVDPNGALDGRPKDMGDLAFYLAGAALVAAAVYLLRMLFL